MIISASRRTDIPAFYGEWFMNRLEAGYCTVPGYVAGQAYRVDLRPEEVDAFAFWTKDLGTFKGRLAEVRARGLPFMVHYTITGYPRCLEGGAPPTELAAEHMHELAERYGPRVAVWRYDPMVFTSATTPDHHRVSFRRLAERLRGATDEVVTSVVVGYRKTARNMRRAGVKHGFSRSDVPAEAVTELVSWMADVARANGMALSLCCQPDLIVEGTRAVRCVEVERLSDVAGREIAAKPKSTRPGCGCHESRDIGAYDTCANGCAYCYAVNDHERTRQRLGLHDPKAEMLALGGCAGTTSSR
ncbi:MAG: DUF1848 domain-containing protein [Planctomycetota bacterium]